jgi:hypothetical protein
MEKIFEKVPTYNFEVENHHNYMVAVKNQNILVHNLETVELGGTGTDIGTATGHRHGNNQDAQVLTGGEYTTITFGSGDEDGSKMIEVYALDFTISSINIMTTYSQSTNGFSFLGAARPVEYHNKNILDVVGEHDFDMYSYGVIDREKIDATENLPADVKYDKVLESLGLDSELYEMNLKIETMDGENILSVGQDIPSSDVKSTVTRNVIIRGTNDDYQTYSQLGKLTLNLYK